MYLFILNGSEEGKRIQLNSGTLTIGRSQNSNLVIPEDNYISGTHAELKIINEETVTITDMDSSNGTYLLGEMVTGVKEVKPGEIFRVGHTFIKLSRRSSDRLFTSEIEQKGAPEAIAVVDLVGSSTIAQNLGDRIASKIKNTLFLRIKENLVKNPAVYSKNTGDGVMLVFQKPLTAIKFSENLMRAMTSDGSSGFHIRIGINYGETYILQDNDRRGMAVDMAFRVESVKVDDMHQTVIGIKKDIMPRVNRIFITEVVHRFIANSPEHKTRCIGFFDLKGFNGRHKIFEVFI